MTFVFTGVFVSSSSLLLLLNLSPNTRITASSFDVVFSVILFRLRQKSSRRRRIFVSVDFFLNGRLTRLNNRGRETIIIILISHAQVSIAHGWLSQTEQNPQHRAVRQQSLSPHQSSIEYCLNPID